MVLYCDWESIDMPTVVAVDIPAGDLWMLPFPPAKHTSHWMADWDERDIEREALARAQVVDGLAWTGPTLFGSTLYVRSREEAMALDLGE